jgi:hypothetical protein
MATREQRASEIQHRIREILRRDWDPIGVADVPEAQDEYDGYVGGVYRLLAQGASPRAVAEHLARIEGDQMGLPSSFDARLDVATKLCALSVKLEGPSGAA